MDSFPAIGPAKLDVFRIGRGHDTYWSHEVLIDSHSEPVQAESWELLEALAARTSVRASIVEHDANFPETLDAVLDQVARARSIIDRRTSTASGPVAARP